jgi:hypothetical protein
MKTPGESIDHLTESVVRAAGIDESEVDRIVSSPFINSRLRARIEAERKHRTESPVGWFATILVAARAITVLLVVTVAAVLTFWLSRTNAATSPPPTITGAGSDDISRVISGGTCALSSTQECAISREEVLATLFADKEQEISK